MKIPSTRRAPLLLMSVLALGLAACGTTAASQPTALPDATSAPAAPATADAPTSGASGEPLQVVATYSILGELVEEVAGERANVLTLVGPGGDAHTYEPTPGDSAALADATLLFENGLGFETWIDDLYSASGSQATRVVATQNITPLPAAEEGDSHEEGGALAHACSHFDDTPELVTAEAGTAPVASIPDDHTRYDVALTDGAGAVLLPNTEAREVLFYVGSDAALTLLRDGASVAPEETMSVTADCDAVKTVYTFDLEAGDYVVQFGPGAGTTVPLVWEEGAHDHGEEAAGGEAGHEGHDHGEFDPHVWHDPMNVASMVEAISEALAAADPANAATYTANAEAYTAQLTELDTYIKEKVASIPEDRRKLVTTHDTFGYFAQRYGFEVLGTALGISTEGADPAAGEIAELVEGVRGAGVPAIFAENVSNPSLMETIASEAGVELAPTLYTDALGEPNSDGATYIDMMRYNVDTITTALTQ